MPAKRVNNVTKEEYIAANREFYAKIFGLTHTFDTKVGNDFISGVSGGERKRVSIAEALAAKGSIYCWDNATRGLDSSTALEFARAIRTMTNLLGTTALVTVYQASENIYETFDKVTVLYAGRQIFCGKTTEAKDYFENMGYLCPPRQSTAEYLTAITDPNGLHEIKPGFEYQVPHTADEFEKYVFVGCLVAMFLYVFFFLPETIGLSLEEIQLLYEEGIKPWKSASWVPPSRRGASSRETEAKKKSWKEVLKFPKSFN